MKNKCQRTEIEALAEKIEENAGSLHGDDAKANALRDASIAGLSAAAQMLRMVAALQDPCSPKVEQTLGGTSADAEDDE